MKNHIDSYFAIAILALVSACVGFTFWLSPSIDDMPKGSAPSPVIQQVQNDDTQRNAPTLKVVDTSQVDTSDWVECMVGGQEWLCPPGWISHDTNIQNFPENETFGEGSITIGVGGAPADQNITEENFSFHKENATNELKEWSGGNCITLRDEEFATLLKCVDTSDDGEYLVRYNSVSRYDNANDVIGISMGTILISSSDEEVYERNEEIVTKIVQEFSISEKNLIAFEVNDTQNLEAIVQKVKAFDATGWNTYTNEEYGFSMQYPADYIIPWKPEKSSQGDTHVHMSEDGAGISGGKYGNLNLYISPREDTYSERNHRGDVVVRVNNKDLQIKDVSPNPRSIHFFREEDNLYFDFEIGNQYFEGVPETGIAALYMMSTLEFD